MGRYGNTAIATLDHRHSRRYGSIAITPLWTTLLLSKLGNIHRNEPSMGYRRRLAVLAALCVIPASPSLAQRSTLAGVYNAEQAARGRDVYAGMCRSCHTAESHTGVSFHKTWEGRSLSELFGYISTKMPKNEPGSLAPEEYADLLAYLLKMNQMPAGPNELPADTVALKTIRIETRPTAAPSRQNR